MEEHVVKLMQTSAEKQLDCDDYMEVGLVSGLIYRVFSPN